MPSITRDTKGRYVVGDHRREYGAYRTPGMAAYRVRQIEASRRPAPGTRRKRPENRDQYAA